MKKAIMPLCERLKYVRTYNLNTQKNIAKLLGVDQTTYCGYENYKAIIPLNQLNTLANYYNVSIDYLMGLVDYTKPIKNMEIDVNVASNNFASIRLENNLSLNEFAKALNISKSAAFDYESKRYSLSTHVCYDLARNFNISVDWLLGKSDVKEL